MAGTGFVAALLAMLLFAVAGVKAELMQLPMAAAACADHAMAAPHGAHAKPDRPHRTCLYCDTAAHAPLVADALPVPQPWVAAWLPARPVRSTGPRGPPALRPKARAPPLRLSA